jgi:hypothetical protein
MPERIADGVSKRSIRAYWLVLVVNFQRYSRLKLLLVQELLLLNVPITRQNV